jgi:hypothetical protein
LFAQGSRKARAYLFVGRRNKKVVYITPLAPLSAFACVRDAIPK